MSGACDAAEWARCSAAHCHGCPCATRDTDFVTTGLLNGSRQMRHAHGRSSSALISKFSSSASPDSPCSARFRFSSCSAAQSRSICQPAL